MDDSLFSMDLVALLCMIAAYGVAMFLVWRKQQHRAQEIMEDSLK